MNKPIIKNSILGGIPTLISAIGIFMCFDFLGNFKNIFIYVTIVLFLLFAGFLIYYAKMEKKDTDNYNDLLNENKQLKDTITSIRNLFNANNSIVASFVSTIEPWTSNINKIANDIRNLGKANEKDWDYDKICTDICVCCKKAINLTGLNNETDISVSLIKYYSYNNTDYVKMIAHSSPQTAKPDIFDVQEILNDCNYQYAKLIKDKTRSIFVLESPEKIKQCFYKKHRDTDLSKYRQYIAIPIMCSKNKILGVLQVTSKYNYVIMDTSIDLKKFSETYITPFIELLILVEKIQKGLFIQAPNNSNENKGKQL